MGKITKKEREKNLIEKRNKKWKDTHRFINGIDHKQCSDCKVWKPCNKDNYYKNKASGVDGFNPYCKVCTLKRSYEWQKNNPDKMNESKRKYEASSRGKETKRLRNVKSRKLGKVKEWQQTHPEKIKEYNLRRESHKRHDISNRELELLYEYANHSCMYCGISEQEAKDLYKQRLHRDHADNEGPNGIGNCVLACKSCNGRKHKKSWDEWYIESNSVYTKERHNLIEYWLNSWEEICKEN